MLGLGLGSPAGTGPRNYSARVDIQLCKPLGVVLMRTMGGN